MSDRFICFSFVVIILLLFKIRYRRIENSIIKIIRKKLINKIIINESR